MKKRGFSLAEMMIVMLIITVVLAATAPMITRKVSRERSDKIFDVLNSNPTNAVEYVKGRNQIIYMNSKNNGYVGIREAGETIPTNSVMFGKSTLASTSAQSLVSIGFGLTSDLYSVNIGNESTSGEHGIALGTKAEAGNAGIAVGTLAKATAFRSTAIGNRANAIGYNSVANGAYAEATDEKSIAIGYGASAKFSSSTAIGAGATTEYKNTIVLGTALDTVYIPGGLVVDQSAVIGRRGYNGDNLYIRPYAAEDGRHFATFQADDWKGEDQNFGLVQDANNTNLLYVKVGPYETAHENWKSDYDDNSRVHVKFDNAYSSDNNFYKYSHSDIRLKNVGEAFTGGLAEINQINTFNYTFKADKAKTPQVGVIAQDLQKIFPNAVITDAEGYLKIRWDEILFSAVNAIKELDRKIIALAEKVQNNTSELTKLNATVEAQQATIEVQAQQLQEQQAELKVLSSKIEKLEARKK